MLFASAQAKGIQPVSLFDGVLDGMRQETSFDAILSGMESATGLDGVLAGMKQTDPFDAILSAMAPDSIPIGEYDTPADISAANNSGILASVAEAMAFEASLEFLANAYSKNPLNTNTYGGSYKGGSPSFSGIGFLPVSGTVTSGFGFRRSFGRMHKGVDIRLSVGDTVRSALDGKVVRVNRDPKGYGLFVVIRHPEGLETRYAHLNEALVRPGMKVMAGDPIALGGNTGNSTGPHLHFETRLYGIAFDPTTMFDFSMPGGMNRMRTLAELDARAGMDETGDKLYSGNKKRKTDINGKHTYIVRNGDTITSVARRAGISTLSLCRLNGLNSGDALTPGRMLRLR